MHSNKTRSWEEYGFTLIEILISLALTAGLALLGMQLFKTQSKGQRTVEANYEVASIVQQIKTILSNPANCASSLQGLKPNGGIPTVLKKEVNAGFENVYAINTWLPGNIKITSYSLSTGYPGLATNETMLRINFSRGKAAIKDDAQKVLKIVFTLNGSGNILTCYAFNNNSDTFWIQSLTQPDDIYYIAGNVGIGVPTPDQQLSVGAGARIDGILIGERSPTVDLAYPYESIGVNSGMNLRLQSPNGIGFHTGMTATEPDDNSKNHFWISATGNVGIRTTSPVDTLDVNGQVVFGATGTSRISFNNDSIAFNRRAATGAIYNSGGHAFQFQHYNSSNAASDRLDLQIYSPGGANLGSHLTISASGNIGMGIINPTAKLDINGPLKVGSAPDTCDATKAGQQRFKSDTKVMQYCNGTSWVTMGGGGLDFEPMLNGLSWSSLSLAASGGVGTSSGSPSISLSSLGQNPCSGLSTITLSAPGMTTSTKAALVAFASFDSSENSPAARVFTTGNQFLGLVGQAGRGGDGRSFGAGGEMMVPLSGQAFRIQFCKRDGGFTTFYYTVKAILNE